MHQSSEYYIVQNKILQQRLKDVSIDPDRFDEEARLLLDVKLTMLIEKQKDLLLEKEYINEELNTSLEN